MKAPGELFPGTIAIVAPHPDDETLGCGGLIAQLAADREIHVVVVTDGARSPISRGGRANPALVDVREEETRQALRTLGVPSARVRFLRHPDGAVSAQDAQLQRALVDALGSISPATTLAPFRFDWHPDHIAVHRLIAAAYAERQVCGELVEYFVYTQRRLLPGGDVRACLEPGRLWAVDIRDVAARKRKALDSYRSQTTRFFDWQDRAILLDDVLDRSCESPEFFLPTTPDLPTRGAIPPWWIAMATTLEPRLKLAKDSLRRWVS